MPDASPSKWHSGTRRGSSRPSSSPPQTPSIAPSPRVPLQLLLRGGRRTPRSTFRGLLSRPSLDEIRAYRGYVDERLSALAREAQEAFDGAITIGVNHEQQHQELILTDIKHAFGCNPLRPAYRTHDPNAATRAPSPEMVWHEFGEGIRAVGHSGDGFAFDNEMPAHKVYAPRFSLASRLVTCGELERFIDDRGYQRPELWLSDGWAAVQRLGWTAPLYWESERGSIFTLEGVRAMRDDEPACHLSYYDEADAFARWAGARLPTEVEWEIAATNAGGPLPQMFGSAWQWTSSAYAPYPRFVPFEGALGEYNGKFMCNQLVLRGSSSATSPGHSRVSYRNFFGPEARWQISGVRLARDR